MDLSRFERLIKGIVEKTRCREEFIGDDENPEYKLTFQVEEDPTRKQEIRVWPFDEDGHDFVRMMTYIGKKQDFSKAQLISFLDLNASLRFGSIGIFQGEVVMICTALFASVVDEDRVINQMKYLIKMADSFEKQMVGLDRK